MNAKSRQHSVTDPYEHLRVLRELIRHVKGDQEEEVLGRRWAEVKAPKGDHRPKTRLAAGCEGLRELLLSKFRLKDPRDLGEQETKRAREAVLGPSSSEREESEKSEGEGDLVMAKTVNLKALDGLWRNDKRLSMKELEEAAEDAGKLDLMLANLKEDCHNIELAAGCVYRLNLLYKSVPCLRKECRVQISSIAPSMYSWPCGPEKGFGPLHLLAELLPSRQTVAGTPFSKKSKDTSLTLTGELHCLANLLEQYPSAPRRVSLHVFGLRIWSRGGCSHRPSPTRNVPPSASRTAGNARTSRTGFHHRESKHFKSSYIYNNIYIIQCLEHLPTLRPNA